MGYMIDLHKIKLFFGEQLILYTLDRRSNPIYSHNLGMCDSWAEDQDELFGF